jgi:alpha,alpha-trehalase
MSKIKQELAIYKTKIKRRATGFIKHDYLVPSGFYEEQWDWDAFFMGVALASEIPSEAIYLKNWALNYIEASDADGFTPGCVTPEGPETGTRAMLMKPFLAQGIYISSINLDDYTWVEPYWDRIVKIVNYRKNNGIWDDELGLGKWKNSMESGADDNLAILNEPDNTVVACDVNTYLYREYKSLALIADKLGKNKESKKFLKLSNNIKENMNKYLWSEDDGIYWNYSTNKNEFIKRVSFSSFVPIWGKIADADHAQEIIEEYLMNPEHMLSDYGIRTLSRKDKGYNNENKIKPHSNWQGPIWPIANYIYIHGLLNYGYKKEAQKVADKVSALMIEDINENGGMHENYDAETGRPLAAPDFVSWNILYSNVHEEIKENRNPFKI